MSQKLLFCYFLILGISVVRADPAIPQSISKIIAGPPPRIVKISEKKSIPAMENGHCALEIVIPDKAVNVVKTSADELQKYLEKSLGVKVPAVNVPTRGKTSLILGDQALTREAGINVDELPRDGFVIKSIDGKIFIAGIDDPQSNPAKDSGWNVFNHQRGTLLGVYDFLERFVGVRFYFPGEIGSVVPKHKELKLPEMDILERPDYPRRRYSSGNAAWFPETKPEPLYHHYLRMESFYVPNCHSMERLEISERFSQAHPEYFALENGRRLIKGTVPYEGFCYSSKGLREEVYKDAEAFLSGRDAASRGLKRWNPNGSQPGFFNVMPHDWFRHCQCPDCLKFYASHSQGELIWDFVADIAERAKKNKLPGYITAMSYAHYREVPPIPLPDNLLVMVAGNGPWAENKTEIREGQDKLILAWKNKLNRKPWLWNYAGKYGNATLPNVPPATPRVIGSYYARHANDICGAFMEAETDHYIFSYLNYYIFARMSWNNSLDVDKILNEHHRLMFGAAAEPMKRFFDRIEEIWMNKIVGNTVWTALGPVTTPPSDYELWEKIYSTEELKRMEACYDEAEKLAGKDTEALRRIAYFRKYFLGRIQIGRSEYEKNRQDVGSWSYNVKSLAPDEKITIDAKLDEPAWRNTCSAYLLPLKEETAEVVTTFKVRKDDKYLYFAVDCGEPAPDEMLADIKENDNPEIWRDAEVELFLCPSGNNVDYYQLIINPTGKIYDAKCKKIGAGETSDVKWNSRFDFKTSRTETGWCIEGRLPLDTLAEIDMNNFRANIGRHRGLRKNVNVKLYTWSPFLKNGSFHDLENFGKFVFDGPEEKPMINNGDFTAPLTGRAWGNWFTTMECVKDASVSMDKQIFRAGGQSLKIHSDDGGTVRSVIQFMPQLKPNAAYRVTFWIKLDNVRRGDKQFSGITVKYLGQNYYPVNWYLGTMPWTRQGFSFKTTDKPPEKFFIQLLMYNARGTVWFDDIRMTEIKNTAEQ